MVEDTLEVLDKEIHILRDKHENGVIDDETYNKERVVLTDRYVACVNAETSRATARIKDMHLKLSNHIAHR